MEKREIRLAGLTKYWSLLSLILIVIIGIVLIQPFGSNPGEGSSPKQTTAIIGTGDIRVSTFGSGTLIAAQELELGFVVGGEVEKILVETGDEVQQGQILAELDDDDFQDDLLEAEQNLRELTSDAAIAATALDLAEAEKNVLTAESTLSFYISPYVYKSEIRLREAEKALKEAIQNADLDPSDKADQKVIEAQAAVENAELSLSINWETYYEEYVPDFFNFRWRDRFGGWHDYFDPPSEIEVAVVWAELAAAEARVKEAEAYLTTLTEGDAPEDAAGSQFSRLEYAIDDLVDAEDALEASKLVAPMDGVITDINVEKYDQVAEGKGLITIAQLEPITLEVSFDEADWRLVEEGNPVEVVFDALPEKTYSGQITFVDPTLQTSRSTTVVSALVELDTSGTSWIDLPLLSGASIEVIAGEVNDAVLLPFEGLQEDNGESGIVLINENDEYTQKEIELGLRNVLYVEVTSGLSVGDEVLIGMN